jgi:hypothetical protein
LLGRSLLLRIFIAISSSAPPTKRRATSSVMLHRLALNQMQDVLTNWPRAIASNQVSQSRPCR